MNFLPEEQELLKPGKWFWRVRGINIAGEPGSWSEIGQFGIRGPAPKPKPPALSISPAHPLIILFSDEQHLEKNWDSVPDELKPYTVFRVEALPAENLFRLIRKAELYKIPVVFQASGPHDAYGRMSSRLSLLEVEQIFQDFSVVKGVYICEQAFRVSPKKEDNDGLCPAADRAFRRIRKSDALG